MAKIKNDPVRYITRASIGGRQPSDASKKENEARVRTAKDFRDAHIDDGMYVTFRSSSRKPEA